MEYLDFLDMAPQESNNPLAVLRAAQEKLRQEEEEKKRAAEAQKMHDEIAAYRQQAIKRAVDSDPLGAAQEVLLQPRTNDPLSKLMERAAEEGPLDKAAKITPQEIERQMYERIWGAPAKSKIGKVGKGISNFLGAFSGLPQDFSKPAMEQFLKIQQQHRMSRANDMTAMSQAARITSSDQNSTAKLYSDLAKTQGKLNLDSIKAIDGTLRTDAYGQSVATDAAYKKSLDDNKKAELLLKAQEMAKTIRNSFEYANYRSKLMAAGPEGRYMADLLRDNLLDYMQMEAGRNAASKGGGSRTSSRETMIQGTVIDPATGNQVKRVAPGPQLSTTTTTPVSPIGAEFMAQKPFAQIPAASGAAKSYMSGQTEAPPTPKIELPKSNVNRFSSTDNPVAAPKARQGYTPVTIVKVTPPGVMSFDMGGPGTPGTNDKFNARKKNVSQLSDAANIVLEGYATGVADRVHGWLKQPVSLIERGRALSDTLRDKVTGTSSGQGSANTEFNNLFRRFKDDPEAEKYINSIQLLQTQTLADYIKEISGAQSAKEEANRLSQVFFKMSDQPETVLKMALELLHRTGTIEAILGAGMNAQDITMSGPARERIRKEKLTDLENRAKQAKLTKMAGGDWKQFMPNAEDFDFNRFLAETEEASGTKFKGVLFQGYNRAPSAREKLKSKITPEDETDAAVKRAIEKYKRQRQNGGTKK